MDDILNERIIETVLALELYSNDDHERMFFDYTQELYKKGILSFTHTYCIQFDFLINGYDWIDKYEYDPS